MSRLRSLATCCLPRCARSPETPASVVAMSALVGVSSDAYAASTVPWKLRLEDTTCKVVKVYDGDSLTLAWWDADAGAVVRANCRLHGIDTPELRSGPGRGIEDQRNAWKCKNMMSDAVLSEIMMVSTIGRTGMDKYGRPLVVIKPHPSMTLRDCLVVLKDHATLNDWALHWLPGCVAYFGGTKGTPTAAI